MTDSNVPKRGDRVRFRHSMPGDRVVILSGIVNGDAERYLDGDGPPTHVPVYVHKGDRCYLANLANVLVDLDDAPAAGGADGGET